MNLDDIVIDPHWWWLIVALILAIGEIVVPGVFLIWLAAAAALVGIVAFVLDVSVLAQAAIFAAAAIAGVYLGRRYLKHNPGVSSDPMLNDRLARMIGDTVVVVEPVSGSGGRVKVGDSVWNASGPDAPTGTRMKIVGARGTTLLVEPV